MKVTTPSPALRSTGRSDAESRTISAPDRVSELSDASCVLALEEGDARYQSFGAGIDVDENLPQAAIGPSSNVISKNRRSRLMHEGI